ncbi:MAG: condensation domain-containing protein, partial [Cyanobacteria bacterium J06632_3]
VTHGETVTLPSKTTAFGHWTRHLASHAPVFEAERDYWTDVCQSVPSLPADSPSGENTVGNTREIVVSLTSQETALLKALKQPVPTLLLCAIAQTIQQWSQNNTLVVDMEGHGRHVWDESLDLSRTVGWFTALYPLRLSLPSASLKDQLSAVQHQLDKVPNGGVGYGLLRSTEAALTSPAEISFNYLGQLAIETAGFITGLDSDTVPVVQSSTKSPESDRKYHFEIVALIENDQLKIRWRYSGQQYQQSTLTQLTQRFVNNLKSLLADCKEGKKANSSTTPRFAAAQVDTSQLNQLMSKLKAREGKS